MIGLGCMRLSTTEVAGAADVIDAAVAAGVELLDTADAYGTDETDLGANERLLARVAHTHRVVTKGGLTRPGGAWIPDGRAKHLAAAARASRERLGVEAIELYLLHAIDPSTPLATSVRALARLRDEGIVRAIGLSNVTPTQLDQALAIAPIDAVEVELGPYKLDALRGGLLARCAERGIEVLAHRPFGGVPGAKRIARDPVLRELAERLGATPHELVLAWLRSLSPVITPLPGATTIATARSAIRGQQLALDDDARATLAAHLVDVGSGPRARATGEVVVILGMPGAGKSTLAAAFHDHARLNRDERGGSLLELARALDEQLAAQPARSVVVDNTYPTRASRAPILEVARRHGAAVRCFAVTTPLEQAQAHAAQRVLDRCGDFTNEAATQEIRPGVQFRYRRAYEPPSLDEGFASIEEIVPPRHSAGRNPGVIVELDGIIWLGKPTHADRIELRPGVREAISRYPLVGATLWRPGITTDRIAAIAERLRVLLEHPIAVRGCPHAAGPPVCWCRKPMPGLALALARDLELDPTRTIVIGRGPADRGFALRAGMPYRGIEAGWP